jgi:hypothetical protein
MAIELRYRTEVDMLHCTMLSAQGHKDVSAQVHKYRPPVVVACIRVLQASTLDKAVRMAVR